MREDRAPAEEQVSSQEASRQEAWKVLLAGGVPLGPAHPRVSLPSPEQLGDAVKQVLRESATLDTSQVETLHAMLSAWESHWPSSFERHLGRAGHDQVRALSRGVRDRNRFLKLRRIALSHLARVL